MQKQDHKPAIRLKPGYHWCAACTMPLHEQQLTCPACQCPNPYHERVTRLFGDDHIDELVDIVRDLHRIAQGNAL